MTDGIIYLDNAATSFPKPEVVHDTVRDFYRDNGVNPGRTGCDLALNAEKMIHQTRKRLSNFFNKSLVDAGKKKDPNRLVFTLNATMSLNLVINGLVRPGDHVVTTVLEHNSVIRPVNHKIAEGAEATFVKPDGEGYLDPEDIRKAIRSNTVLVIVNHASNVTGVVQNLEAIGAVCHGKGVPFAVDTAQTAGVLPIDMAKCHISFLTFTGHKGLFAPTGTGGICVADDAEITGTIYGGTGVRSAVPLHLEEYPYRLEAGTLNLAGIAGLSAGLDWVEERGVKNIHRHEMELLGLLQDGLLEIPGVKIWGTTSLTNRVATVSITAENYDASDIGTILDVDYNIQTRTGLHCAPLIHEHHGTVPRGTVRLSVGPFNTRDHIETAVKAMAQIAADRFSTTKV
ncbi:MAG: aminotransferase class V-fold PLP-dependent enzyme [Candidatus Eisenbacteria bacterium]|uniref:cysteine desulfurase n=1 Tax=Eiseniibacteriota bacterium TaxID=2212470 RepID=A0A948RUX7_UNCEI|nr:aminotransferase class V-fold PLP-dependent enzyme [Candidatus Eisenbacteria bacterium]MBU1950075.1 aminotransferase class V-fold PLP-dependent enzyme [Candidatus Eisenbacteria bacterium]MBU2690996.1 aminotransferase class V-fold PLP-dependent enzyme [Candidatus Eisenbacteria bacterium]